jgi:hypothetical protein
MIVKNSDLAFIGIGKASGEDRAQKAAEQAVNSPLLNDNDISEAKRILIDIRSGLKNPITMSELGIIMDFIHNAIDKHAIIKRSVQKDDSLDTALDTEIVVTIIATGFNWIEKNVGEPWSATENLKPILLGDISDETKRKSLSEDWEVREEWFWQNRTENEQTADEGMNDFFVWYWQIRLLQEKTWKNKKSNDINPKELFLKQPEIVDEDVDKPSLDKWKNSTNPDTVHTYFHALKKLIKICNENEKIIKILQNIDDKPVNLEWFRNKKSDLHIVLPLITYLQKFSDSKYFYEFVRRIRKNYFD